MSARIESIDGGNAEFGATQWGMIRLSAKTEAPGAREALSELCTAYWFPLYAFLRRKNYTAHDAQDLTQSFLAHFVESRSQARADPLKGKFRSYLLSAFQNFLADDGDRRKTQKRGGALQFVSLNEQDAEARIGLEASQMFSPEKTFELQWANTLLDRAMAQVRVEFIKKHAPAVFDALKIFLLGDKGIESYEKVSAQLAIPLATIKTLIHRMRRDYRAILRSEIANTLSPHDDVDEEIRHLCKVLASAGL